ncbi:MAG: transcriptional regulator [Gemmatimonadetes bacterium RBG_16_66_8]|nr:MAG: transcriptional regulator [Gemmatimonadetes bacterium RBG_16_66_8]
MSDSAFRALADPTRRRILELLAGGDRTAGQLAEEFAMTFASVSHHLRVLREAELVTAEREGQNIRYRLNTTVFQDVTRYLMKLFAGKK